MTSMPVRDPDDPQVVLHTLGIFGSSRRNPVCHHSLLRTYTHLNLRLLAQSPFFRAQLIKLSNQRKAFALVVPKILVRLARKKQSGCSFQLAKIRSQRNSSLTRVLPLHWDEEERKENFIGRDGQLYTE